MKLGDFGLTMSMKQEVAISPVGTVEYMAPEVMRLHNAVCEARNPGLNRLLFVWHRGHGMLRCALPCCAVPCCAVLRRAVLSCAKLCGPAPVTHQATLSAESL